LVEIIYDICYNLIDGIVINEASELSISAKSFFKEDLYFYLFLNNSKTIKALNAYKEEIKGKNVVCLVNDLFENIHESEC
jgi:hypothetical protein